MEGLGSSSRDFDDVNNRITAQFLLKGLINKAVDGEVTLTSMSSAPTFVATWVCYYVRCGLEESMLSAEPALTAHAKLPQRREVSGPETQPLSIIPPWSTFLHRRCVKTRAGNILGNIPMYGHGPRSGVPSRKEICNACGTPP